MPFWSMCTVYIRILIDMKLQKHLVSVFIYVYSICVTVHWSGGGFEVKESFDVFICTVYCICECRSRWKV